MHLHTGAVQRYGLNLDLHDLRLLQLLEGAIHHTRLCPSTHARVNRVPVAESLGQASPLAAMLSNIEDGIEHLQVGQADVAALLWQAVFDLRELG